ncbi:MAG: hypothetical protein M1833_001686 [Piccolia ochrophora]|nr:MAG: hypothetical protein M1833_001686 [Piccolia ochrophora]
MALPPQTVSIKRKKEDDPVEALYIHNEHQQKKQRRFTDFVYNLVQPQDGLSKKSLHTPSSLRSASSRTADGVPVVRATKPGEEDEENRRSISTLQGRAAPPRKTEAPSAPFHGQVAASITPQPAHVSVSRDESSTYLPSQMRRFHLSHSHSTISGSPIGKAKKTKKTKVDIAVFVENIKAMGSGNSKSTSGGAPEKAGSGGVKPNGAPPNEVSVDKHKASASSSPTVNNISADIPSQADDSELRLATDLERFAIQNLQIPLRPPSTSTATTPLSKPPIRHRPNPSAARYKDRHPSPPPPVPHQAYDTSMTDARDDIYVFDTYIRTPLPTAIPQIAASSDVVLAPLPRIPPNAGLLIITAETQEVWDQLVHEGEMIEGEEDGEGWDDEDSNGTAALPRSRSPSPVFISSANASVPHLAEDNPANDYPDADADLSPSLSDEDGLGVYGYSRQRRGAFSDDDDDGEGSYGEEPSWSGDEN